MMDEETRESLVFLNETMQALRAALIDKKVITSEEWDRYYAASKKVIGEMLEEESMEKIKEVYQEHYAKHG